MAPLDWLVPASTFLLICLAGHRIGRFFVGAKLPLITGFLATGILVGPYVLGLLTTESLTALRFVDEAALAFIAFAAGAELHFREMRNRLKAIAWTTFGLVGTTFTAAVCAVLLLADQIPFLATIGPSGRLAVALLAGSVLIARSPSSAIAVVNELRARGPFTRSVLGVTVVLDVVVIVIFAFSTSIADVLVTGAQFRAALLALVVGEVLLSILLGIAVGFLIPWLTRLPGAPAAKNLLLLALGYSVFAAIESLHQTSPGWAGLEVYLEPLLVCMVAGFTVSNFSSRRTSFERMLDETGTGVYVAFFLLAGASLQFDTLLGTWSVALALVAVRFVAVFLGAFLGGWTAGDPMRLNRIAGLAFITQAGIGLGLAKEVAAQFPEWGGAFATMMIAVIVMNEMMGPPLFKLALHLAGEAHVKAGKHDLRGTPLALVFGLETEALSLARQLGRHGWQAKIVTRRPERLEPVDEDDVEIVVVADLSIDELKRIGAGKARAFVALMSEADNLIACEAAYEQFGTRILVVRSTDREQWPKLRALGASIVDPGVAMIGLLDHLVRSPAVGAMVLDAESDQDVVDIEIESHDLDGVALRDVHLPLDTLVLSVHRDGANLISHGYTELRHGDVVTVMGSRASLEEIALTFGA